MCNFCEVYKQANEIASLLGEKADVTLRVGASNVVPEGMRVHSHIEFDNIYVANYCPVCGKRLEGEDA